MLYVRVKTTLWSVAAILAATMLVCPATGKPAKTSKLSKYITNLCKRSDPQLSKCMAENMKNVLKFAKTGIPELNIPALEPYVIQKLDLKEFKGIGDSLIGGNVKKSDKYEVLARNIVIHRVSEFIIHDLKADLEKKEFFVDIGFPQLQVESDCDINLTMLNIPIKSTGPVYANITDILVKATLSGKTVKRRAETYFLFDTIDIKIDFKDYSIMIDKLFKKEHIINKVLNDMVKNEKSEIKKIAIPIVEELSGKMIIEMINKVMSGLPIEEIFLPD